MYRCRFCQSGLLETFADLGMSPLSNSFLSGAQLNGMEPFYPLHAYVCGSCFLVQLAEFETPEQIWEYAEAILPPRRGLKGKETSRGPILPIITIGGNGPGE